ncbi:hypothetical protein ABT186_23185 [Streptomyces sp. NPDC001634]|uniref:hypothetical protein n=1 Tax=Streptomyces sp. NPDC001634 TaxID=3154390 RepID=UPI003332030C
MIRAEHDHISFTCTDPCAGLDFDFQTVLLGRRVKLDHYVHVLPDVSVLMHETERLVLRGGRVAEEPHLFPDDVCPDQPVHPGWRKHIATVAAEQGLIVLAAPASECDQLTEHLKARGTDVPHHIAVSVTDVDASMAAWTAAGWQAGRLAADEDLAQIFLTDRFGQIVELISRSDPDSAMTFTCPNIARLSATEDQLRQEGRQP